MPAILTVKDFSPHVGRWVVVTIETRRAQLESKIGWRVWVWGTSERLVYLANAPTLAQVWCVPYAVFQTVVPLDAWPGAPHIRQASWYSTWDALYAVDDPYEHNRSKGKPDTAYPVDNQQDLLP